MKLSNKEGVEEGEMKTKKEEDKKKKRSSAMQETAAAAEGTELQEKKKQDSGGEKGGGKTVMVGVKLDADSRELLTWSLFKLADAGDRVVALHVLPSATSDSRDASINNSSSLLSLVKSFDAMIAVYDGFCNLKQVTLEMKIARGSPVRKVLVREAISHGASRLVLGVAKNSLAAIVSSSTSISKAKYCARKLPQDCSVFAVSNGKTLFRREKSPAAQPTVSAGQQALTSSKLLNAMMPPSRFGASSIVHPDHKPVNPDAEAIIPMEANLLAPEKETKIPKELEHLQDKYSSVCKVFSYNDLMHMTSDFSPERLIGKGGSSHVYKGSLPDGKQLAVKILKSSEDAVNEFVSEIQIITSLQHKNILSLVGFCFENGQLILVYDFLSRGSLEENLHGLSSNKGAPGWAERYKIAVGVAEALDYLHGTGNVGAVVHRDVKSSNILLSDDFEPQLADFGLAIWASASASQLICNDVAGTFGYLAPEYFMYGKVNEKIDVYAFGVVLLELISGRKPVSTGCAKGQESLVMWAMPFLQGGKLEELVDPCLGTSYKEAQLERMMLAASLCIRRSPRSRPQMTLVMKLLQGNDDVVQRARSQVGNAEEVHELDDEAAALHSSNIQSYINLALQDVDDDSLSVSSVEPPTMEEYLQGRWSRSSSFD